MQKKENVYGENTGAEKVATANAGEKEEWTVSPTEASAALGKFKDVDALAKAYDCLQAEFTRRSQKLKELQKQVDNLTAERSENAEESGAEKLRKNAAARKAEEEKFDDFVSDLEMANVRAVSLSEGDPPVEKEALQGETLQTGENAAPLGIKEGNGGGGFSLSSEELYERAKADEGVRLKLIGEYLSSIGKSGAPLLRGGAGALATPPQKAKSIDEAGSMALLMFKNGGMQA